MTYFPFIIIFFLVCRYVLPQLQKGTSEYFLTSYFFIFFLRFYVLCICVCGERCFFLSWEWKYGCWSAGGLYLYLSLSIYLYLCLSISLSLSIEIFRTISTFLETYMGVYKYGNIYRCVVRVESRSDRLIFSLHTSSFPLSLFSFFICVYVYACLA